MMVLAVLFVSLWAMKTRALTLEPLTYTAEEGIRLCQANFAKMDVTHQIQQKILHHNPAVKNISSHVMKTGVEMASMLSLQLCVNLYRNEKGQSLVYPLPVIDKDSLPAQCDKKNIAGFQKFISDIVFKALEKSELELEQSKQTLHNGTELVASYMVTLCQNHKSILAQQID